MLKKVTKLPQLIFKISRKAFVIQPLLQIDTFSGSTLFCLRMINVGKIH